MNTGVTTKQQAYMALMDAHWQIKNHLVSQPMGMCTPAIAGNHYLVMDWNERMPNELCYTSLDPRNHPVDCLNAMQHEEIGDLGAEDINDVLIEIRKWLDRPTFLRMRAPISQAG